MLKMEDEAGDDTKLLAVPIDKLSSLYRGIATVREVPQATLDQIKHFFEHYKDLDPASGCEFSVGWGLKRPRRKSLTESTDICVQDVDCLNGDLSLNSST